MELFSLIGDVWIIDKNSGVCLIHKNYDKTQKIDSNLFSGLLTAIINFSAEVTGGDYVKAVTMGSKKFFYSISDYFIIAVSMDLGFNEVDAKIFLGNILTSFVKLGFADKALSNQDVLILKPFELAIDNIVQDTAKGLSITSDATFASEQYQAIQEIDSPEVKLKKAKIEESIENAEWALSIGYYKEAISHFNEAINLFKAIEEFDMAKWCEEMIELTKMMELQTEVEAYSQSEEEATQINHVDIPDTGEASSVTTKKAELLKMIEKSTKKTAPKDITKKEIKPKPKKYAQRRPFLVKKLGKQKLPFLDLKVLRLCDGTNNIENICKKSDLPLIKVNEILKKYQKKKLLRIKRVI